MSAIRGILLLVFLLAAPLVADADCPPGLYPYGYQQITVSTTATGFTIPAGSKCAQVSVSTNGVRVRDDGTNPTSALGYPYGAGFPDGSFSVPSGSLPVTKMIRSGSSDAEVNVLYYGP